MRLPAFRLEEYFAIWEFQARYNLASSDAQSLTLSELLDLADTPDRERWEKLGLRYIQTRGTPELLQAIAGTYDTVAADDVMSFAGAQEGLYCALQALLDANDHAVVLVPNYQSMESVPSSICQVTGVALHPENAWELDLDELRAALRPNTRLVAVNFLNNPTGKIISQDVFRDLFALCEKHNLYLLSDEVYRGFERDANRCLPQAADVYDRALSLNVMSKTYGLAGLRVGWIACRDRRVLQKMGQLKQYLSICNAAPSETLATIALKARSVILERNRRLTTLNLQKVSAFFARHSDLFEWHEPEGACIAYPRYLGTDGVESFCARLVLEAGVLLLPASLYRSDLLPTPGDRFRIGYGRDGIDSSLAAFDEFVDSKTRALV